MLTPVERAVSRLQSLPKAFAPPAELVYRHGDMKWGDLAEIREILLKIKRS